MFSLYENATLDLVSGSCEFIKKDQQRCKNRISVGQHFCWQHGVRAKWKSLPALIKVIIVAVGFLGSLASIYELWPHGKPTNVDIQTSGDNSPVVQDNQGSVEFNNSQSNQPKKKSKDSGNPTTAKDNK